MILDMLSKIVIGSFFIILYLTSIAQSLSTKTFSYLHNQQLKCNGKKKSLKYLSTSSAVNKAVHSLSQTNVDMILTEEEEEYIEKLCSQRNISFDKIKNTRDLSSLPNSPIIPNRVYRSGRLSDASSADIDYLLNTIGAQTLIDLRSPTELKDDPNLNNHDLFNHFNTLCWNGRRKVKEFDDEFSKRRRIVKGITRFYNKSRRRNKNKNKKETVDNDDLFDVDILLTAENSSLGIDSTLLEHPLDVDEILSTAEQSLDSTLMVDSTALSAVPKQQRNRYFISLMNEFKYVRGTLSKLRKRDITRAVLKSPGAIFSKKVREQCKDVFISEINDGGLPMLNDLVLRWGAPGILYTLDLISNKQNHPVIIYCTAGKDRTGIIAAILLLLCGVPEKEIVEDYSLSANVYAEMDDHKAMVGALSQRNLDPKTFLGAPPKVMRDTIKGIRQNYGSLEAYLDFIGFNQEKRDRLKQVLTT